MVTQRFSHSIFDQNPFSENWLSPRFSLERSLSDMTQLEGQRADVTTFGVRVLSLLVLIGR